tara:strand:+ start:122 stop:520 length:399 start_codon:yes stop_codon:yes gene_type:complete
MEKRDKKNDGQDEQVISDLSAILANDSVSEHTIRVDQENPNLVMKVQVKQLSFLDMQEAIKSFIGITASGEVEINLAGYWRYMYENCIISTTPATNTTQLIGLNQFVGSQLAAILPQPQDLIAGPLVDGNNE